MSIRVYVTADTDTSTPCASVPHLYHYTRKVGRMQLFYAMGGTLHPRLNMQTISNTPTCTLSQFYNWSIRRNVSMIDSWDSCYHCLLVGGWGVRRHLSLVASTAPLGVGVSGRLVSGYSLPLLTPPTLSRILDHMALPRECPLICCLMRRVNSSCWTCSDARNIGRYNSSRYDSIRYTQYRFRYDTDPIIVRSLTVIIFTYHNSVSGHTTFPYLAMPRGTVFWILSVIQTSTKAAFRCSLKTFWFAC